MRTPNDPVPDITVVPPSPRLEHSSPPRIQKTESFFFSTKRNEELFPHNFLTVSKVKAAVNGLSFEDEAETPTMYRFDYVRKANFGSR